MNQKHYYYLKVLRPYLTPNPMPSHIMCQSLNLYKLTILRRGRHTVAKTIIINFLTVNIYLWGSSYGWYCAKYVTFTVAILTMTP